MQLSVWSSYFKQLSVYDAINEFMAAGFGAMELSRDHARELLALGGEQRVACDFRAYLSDNDFKVPQGHILMTDMQIDDPSENIDISRRWIDFFIELGIENIVVHIGRGLTSPPASLSYEELLNRRVFAVEKLLNSVNGTDSFLCVENLPKNMRTAQEFLDLFECVKHPKLKICFDTGHLNQVSEENAEHFIGLVGKHIKATHINDNDSVNEQHLLPFTQMCKVAKNVVRKVDFEQVVKSLDSVGYDNLFNFEIPGESDVPLEILRAKLKYIKSIGEYLLNPLARSK